MEYCFAIKFSPFLPSTNDFLEFECVHCDLTFPFESKYCRHLDSDSHKRFVSSLEVPLSTSEKKDGPTQQPSEAEEQDKSMQEHHLPSSSNVRLNIITCQFVNRKYYI